MQILKWPESSPRGAVARFCREHGLSRAAFYKIRALADPDDPFSGIEVKSSRPLSSPSKTPPQMVELLLQTRADLKSAGWDFGPESVRARLSRMGLEPPSRATVARIFTAAGVVKAEPRKRPRTAMRRFVYPAPNCCWQIDGTEWTLETGRRVVILQIIDDHSRLAVATLAAAGETGEAALRVVKIAMNRHGIPQKFLSDNGLAFNQERRGRHTKLTIFLRSLGVEPITGKPGRPTTQGKNERMHQTLFKYLNTLPAAPDLDALQEQINTFDQHYNTHRPHQALPGRMTPQEAWDTTEKAPSPTPNAAWTSSAGSLQRRALRSGTVQVGGVNYRLGLTHADTLIHIVSYAETISFYDSRGTHITSHPIPVKGTRYVGNGQPRFGGPGRHPKKTPPTETSTTSLDITVVIGPETSTVHDVLRHHRRC